MLILIVTLCNIRMLQSVSHIIGSNLQNKCQIWMVVALLDQAHQVTSLDTTFVEFLPESSNGFERSLLFSGFFGLTPFK